MAPVSTMTKDEIYPWMVNVLHEMFELDKARITPEANLYSDLDIDSIDAVDLVVKLNQLTGKRFKPDVFKSVRTVQDVVDALAALLET
jgi:acyl carrier protein